MVRKAARVGYRTARKIVVGVVGASVIALGVALLFLPGPALVVIPAGLGILSLEFAWARRWLRALKQRGDDLVESVRGRRRWF